MYLPNVFVDVEIEVYEQTDWDYPEHHELAPVDVRAVDGVDAHLCDVQDEGVPGVAVVAVVVGDPELSDLEELWQVVGHREEGHGDKVAQETLTDLLWVIHRHAVVDRVVDRHVPGDKSNMEVKLRNSNKFAK